MSNGLWSQLGASDIVQSCGAELAEVLNQVDILIEKKRQEWETDLIKAEKSARDASQREREAQKRLKEQQTLYEERISSLRIDLGKLKEAYLKLEKHNSKDKYKKMLIDKKSKLELTSRELENYKVQNGALHTENAQLQVQIKNLQMEKDSDKLKLVMAQKEVTNLSSVRDENEMLQSDLDKMKKKYSELKKVAGRMSSEMKTEREAFIDSISKVSSSATASPRTESTKSSSVYVLPLPVLDTSFGTSQSNPLDEEHLEENKENQPLAHIKMSSRENTPISAGSSSNMAHYKEEDDKLANELHSKIAAHITDFNQYLSTI